MNISKTFYALPHLNTFVVQNSDKLKRVYAINGKNVFSKIHTHLVIFEKE